MDDRFARAFAVVTGLALAACGPRQIPRGTQPPGAEPTGSDEIADAGASPDSAVPLPVDSAAPLAVDSALATPDLASAGEDAAEDAHLAPDRPGRETTVPADAAPPPAGGAVLWQNDGTAAPGGHLLKDPGCTLTEVTSPTYRGGKTLKHVVNFPDTVKLSVHCEVARDPVAMQGDDLYYGWAFMLGDDWPDTYGRKSVISQMTGRGKCWNQLDFLTLTGVQHFTDEAGGGPDSCTPGSGNKPLIADVVSRSVWHRIVLHKVWKGDTTGRIEIWFDGVKTATADNVATGWGDLSGGYAWHVGVYAGIDQARLGSRTIYTAHFRVARTYAAADPAGWGAP